NDQRQATSRKNRIQIMPNLPDSLGRFVAFGGNPDKWFIHDETSSPFPQTFDLKVHSTKFHATKSALPQSLRRPRSSHGTSSAPACDGNRAPSREQHPLQTAPPT